MLRKRNIPFCLALLSAIPFISVHAVDPQDFRNAGEAKGAIFKICKQEKDGSLHVFDDADGAFNNTLQRTLSQQELNTLRGKYLKLSCSVRQSFSTATDSVGITITVRTGDRQTFSRYARLRTTGSTGWESLTAGLFIPENSAAVYIGLDCASGYGRRAEAWFRDLKLECRDKPVCTRAGQRVAGLIRIGSQPLSWCWRETKGIYMTPERSGMTLRPVTPDGGSILFQSADHAPLILSGINDKSALILEIEGKGAFSIDLISYGKANRTLRVPASPEAVRTLRFPLSEFAPLNDLAELNGLELSTDQPLKIKQITFSGMTPPKRTINLLPDPSFEISAVPAPSYPLLGDYRTEKTMKHSFPDPQKAFHGKRSLRLEPGGFFSWTAYDQAENGAVFSFYAQADQPGTIDVMLHPLETDMHGTNAPIYRKRFELTPGGWKRNRIISPRAKRNPPPQQFNFYRMEIRNSGKNPVWIDAVQLEQGTVEPGKFTDKRDSASRVNIFPAVSPERYKGLKQGINRKQGSIPLQVLNPSDRALRNAIVSGGIPFPKGELFQASRLGIFDGNGNEIAAQFTPLAYRPVDGSILAVKVDFQANLKAGKQPFTLKYGLPEKTERQNLARRTGAAIRIDTGTLKLDTAPGRLPLLNGLPIRCMIKTMDGKLRPAAPDTVELEENGPLSSTVLIRGRAEVTYELRLTAFAGKPYLRIDYSFENGFVPKKTPLMKTLRAIWLELPGGTTWSADRFSGTGTGVLIQRHARSGRQEWDVFEEKNGTVSIHPGTKLSGRASAGKTTVRVEKLWENAPRGFGFDNTALKLYLWPENGVNPLDLPLGLSASMRLWLNPDGTELPEEKMPLLLPENGWLRHSGVFGDLEDAAALKSGFPKAWKLIDDVFRAEQREAAVRNMYGYGDFGDFGSRAWVTNHETAAVRNLWTRYLRTGTYEDFDIAQDHARHQREIDMCHAGRFMKGVYPHYTWTHINYNFHTGHFWLTGLVNHYLLTGDRRTLDSIIGAASVLIQKSVIKYKNGRERHRMLFHLAEIYELTGNPEVRKAFERQYSHGGASDPAAYYGGISHEALLKLYDVTGERKYLDRLNREAKEFLAANTPLPMPEVRTKPPTLTGAADEGRGCMRLFMEAVMAKRLGSADYLHYLSKGTGTWLWSLLSPNGRDTCLEWAAFHLSGLRSFGLKEDPRLPSEYSFLHRLTGRMRIQNGDQPFELELLPDADGKAALELYRIRSFRYWSFKRDNDKVLVTANDGKAGKTMELYNNVPAEYGVFRTDSPDGKAVRLKLRFINDCWGGISSGTPFRISSERWFAARAGIAVPVGFYLRAPANGPLRISWRWLRERNTNAGESLGILLETPEGKRLASDVFTIPFEYQEDRKICTYSAELTIPEAYRGKILKAWISDPKWIEWRLSGLDDPWLADKPGFLER